MTSDASGIFKLVALAAVVAALCGLSAPAHAEFFNDVKRTFQTDIPHFFQDDIPCAFGGQPTSHTKTSCKKGGGSAQQKPGPTQPPTDQSKAQPVYRY